MNKTVRTLLVRGKPGVLAFWLLAVSIFPLLNAIPVSADGESYAWRDYLTINVTGGGLQNTTLTTSTYRLPNTPETFNGVFKITSQNNCEFAVGVTLTSPTSGRITSVDNHRQFISARGSPTPLQCSDSTVSGYRNKVVTISGTRPTAGETAETQSQKQFSVTLRTALPPDQAPATVSFTVTGANNFNQVMNLTRQQDETTISYTGQTTLEPGDYSGTANAVVTGPQAFTKVKFQPLTKIYGEFANDRTINVTVEIHFLGGKPDRIGPIQLALKKPDGTQVATARTEAFNTSDTDTGLAPAENIEVTLYARGTFANVDQGVYKICVVSANKCVDYTKGSGPGQATIDLTSAESSSVLAEATTPEGGPEEDENSCENSAGALGWILCPVLRGIESALSWVDEQIQRLLAVDNSYVDNAGIKAAWANIKNLAYLILVPIMLVMIIGTALGFELVSAYTLKKSFPRLVIAIIFISLSYPACVFLINLANAVGGGTQGIMLQPFAGAQTIALSNIIDVDFFTGIVAGPAAIGAAIALWVYGTGLIIPTIIAFLILMLRQMFIVGLVLLAPLAILAWIFPGNDKLWKFWWGTFSKLLIMYPLIMGLLALGKIFAYIIDSSQAAGLEGAVIAPLMALGAYILPYALIPFTFKFAGGALATLSGMANDRSRGLSDKIKEGQQIRKGRVKSGDLPGMLGGRRMGAVTSGLASGPKGWKNGRAGMRGYRETQGNISAQQQAEASQIWQANKTDDKFLTAHANRKLAEKRMADAKSPAEKQAWQNALAKSDLVPRTAGSRMASAQALAASGYNISTGRKGYRELSDTMAQITGASVTHNEDGTTTVSGAGAAAYRNAMNNAQYSLKGAGRFDLAGINDGAGYSYEKGVDKANGYLAGNAKTDTHVAGAMDIVGEDYAGLDKDTGAAVLKDAQGNKTTLADSLASGVANGTIKADKVLAQHARLLDALPGATGGNKKEIQAQLSAIEDGLVNNQAVGINEDAIANQQAVRAGVRANRAQSRQNLSPDQLKDLGIE